MKISHILIEEQTFEKARKKIHENNNKGIIFSSSDDDLNRKILEKEKIDILLLKESKRKDFQKQRNSGLNQVLAKEMKKSSVKLGIDLDELTDKNLDKKQKSEVLARIKQNITLCNKNHLKLALVSKEKRDSYDLKSLGLILGVQTNLLKDIEFIFFE